MPGPRLLLTGPVRPDAQTELEGIESNFLGRWGQAYGDVVSGQNRVADQAIQSAIDAIRNQVFGMNDASGVVPSFASSDFVAGLGAAANKGAADIQALGGLFHGLAGGFAAPDFASPAAPWVGDASPEGDYWWATRQGSVVTPDGGGRIDFRTNSTYGLDCFEMSRSQTVPGGTRSVYASLNPQPNGPPHAQLYFSDVSVDPATGNG